MSIQKRVYFETWGERPAEMNLAGFAVVHPDDVDDFNAELDAVKRSIERTTGLVICGCTPQGTACTNGKPDANHYKLTLGRAVPYRWGGYSVKGSLWISIPCS